MILQRLFLNLCFSFILIELYWLFFLLLIKNLNMLRPKFLNIPFGVQHLLIHAVKLHQTMSIFQCPHGFTKLERLMDVDSIILWNFQKRLSILCVC